MGSKVIELNDNDLHQLRSIQMMIFKDIQYVCEKYNLICMLGGGSVLGAIRHGGFIPWDDDMDLNMYRDDYDKFVEVFDKEFSDKYELFVPDGKHRVSNLFLKVSLKGTLLQEAHENDFMKKGVSIDVFPIENASNHAFIRKIKGAFANLYKYIVISTFLHQSQIKDNPYYSSNTMSEKIVSFIVKVTGKILSFRSYEVWYNKYDRFVQLNKKTSYVTVPTGRKQYNGEVQPSSVYFPVHETQFEDINVKVPHDYDTYLSNLYGNYMEIPPVEKREKHYYTVLDFGKYKNLSK